MPHSGAADRAPFQGAADHIKLSTPMFSVLVLTSVESSNGQPLQYYETVTVIYT